MLYAFICGLKHRSIPAYYHKQEKGYQSYYAWVLFLHEKPVEIFVRRTTYDSSGGVLDTKVFSSKEVTANTLEQAGKTLSIKI